MSEYFFTNLMQQTTDWVPPPGPEHPQWLDGFDAASPQQKKNIANSWLSALNTNYISEDCPCRARFLTPYYRTYIKIAPYATPEYFKSSAFNGTFDAVTEKNNLVRWNNTPTDMQDNFVNALERSLFSYEQDVKSGYQDLIGTLHTANNHALRQVAKFYPMLLDELWKKTKDPATSHDPDWLSMASFLTVRTVFDLQDPQHVSKIVDAYPIARAWHLLSTQSKYMNTVDSTFTALIKEQVHSTDPVVAAQCLKVIILQAIKANGDSEPTVRGWTLLNPGSEKTSDIYKILSEWVPHYETYWKTAESLDIGFEQAIDNLHKGVQLDVVQSALPTELSLS